MTRFWAVLATLGLRGCKAVASTAAADAGPTVAAAPDVELATKLPSPANPTASFKPNDDVAVIKDDGTFEIEASVQANGGKLVFVPPATGNSVASRLAKSGWMSVATAQNLTGTEKTAEQGYQLRVGEGRFAETAWYPSTQVFPAPWSGVGLKVGDTFYQRRFGDFPNVKCAVTELPTVPGGDVSAKCDGNDRTQHVKRQDMALAFKVPASLAEVQPGQIVYFDKMYWAIVVGKQDNRAVIRQTGFASKDKAVDLSKLEEIR